MLGLGKWLSRRRRTAEDAALLDAQELQENETYREQHGGILSSPAPRPAGVWDAERAEEAEFKPPKY